MLATRTNRTILILIADDWWPALFFFTLSQREKCLNNSRVSRCFFDKRPREFILRRLRLMSSEYLAGESFCMFTRRIYEWFVLISSVFIKQIIKVVKLVFFYGRYLLRKTSFMHSNFFKFSNDLSRKHLFCTCSKNTYFPP